MIRFPLPVCLLLSLVAVGAVAARAVAAPPAHAVVKRTPQEKLALAWLGQIAAGPRARAERARRLFAALPNRAKRRPLVEALRCEPARLRIFAAGALVGLDDPTVVRPLLWRLVREPKREVRTSIAAAVTALHDPTAVHALGRALWAREGHVRTRAAEALGRLGDARAFPYLIARWERRAGDFPRSYFAQVSQNAYLAGFDVEVA